MTDSSSCSGEYHTDIVGKNRGEPSTDKFLLVSIDLVPKSVHCIIKKLKGLCKSFLPEVINK